MNKLTVCQNSITSHNILHIAMNRLPAILMTGQVKGPDEESRLEIYLTHFWWELISISSCRNKGSSRVLLTCAS